MIVYIKKWNNLQKTIQIHLAEFNRQIQNEMLNQIKLIKTTNPFKVISWRLGKSIVS